MAKSLPTPFNPPPPTTLLRWRHSFADAKRRKFLTPNLMFSGHESGRVKFEAEIYKFNFKFKCKTIRRSVFSSDEAAASEARERTSRP